MSPYYCVLVQENSGHLCKCHINVFLHHDSLSYIFLLQSLHSDINYVFQLFDTSICVSSVVLGCRRKKSGGGGGHTHTMKSRPCASSQTSFRLQSPLLPSCQSVPQRQRHTIIIPACLQPHVAMATAGVRQRF